MDTGFGSLSYKNILAAGGVGEGMDTGYVQPSYNNILIRELYITSNDAGSSSYGEQNYVYRNDRDAILAVSREASVNSELGAKEARMSFFQSGESGCTTAFRYFAEGKRAMLGAMRSHDAFFSVDTTPSPAQGFTEAAVRSYEKGKRTPCYRFLCALQHAFGVDINQFLPQDERDLWEV